MKTKRKKLSETAQVSSEDLHNDKDAKGPTHCISHTTATATYSTVIQSRTFRKQHRNADGSVVEELVLATAKSNVIMKFCGMDGHLKAKRKAAYVSKNLFLCFQCYAGCEWQIFWTMLFPSKACAT